MRSLKCNSHSSQRPLRVPAHRQFIIFDISSSLHIKDPLHRLIATTVALYPRDKAFHQIIPTQVRPGPILFDLFHSPRLEGPNTPRYFSPERVLLSLRRSPIASGARTEKELVLSEQLRHAYSPRRRGHTEACDRVDLPSHRDGYSHKGEHRLDAVL
jgi:hypothetical protein